MKGLSPFIEAVMLICFTIAVGGIVSIFVNNYHPTINPQQQSIADNQTCSAVCLQQAGNLTSDGRNLGGNLVCTCQFSTCFKTGNINYCNPSLSTTKEFDVQ